MAALLASKPRRFDVVDASDLTFLGGTAQSIAEEVQAQHGGGYRTGVLHVPSPILNRGRSFHHSVLSCVQTGQAELLELGAPAEARTVIVRSPRSFARIPDTRLPIETERVVVISNHSHYDTTGERPHYAVDPLEVDESLRRLFDAPVVWAPIGPTIRNELESIAPSLEMLPDDWYNVIDVDAWAKDRSHFVSNRPVLGRHSRNHPLKWPDTREAVLAAYPDDPRFEVRILGSVAPPRDVLAERPASWTMHAYDAISPRRFLHGIDFFVYFHHPLWVEAFGRTILEALATGCPAILPPHFEPLYRDACLYLEPEEVGDRILDLYADLDTYRSLARRSEARARERFGHDAHLRRLERLIGPPDGRARAASRARRVLLFVVASGVTPLEVEWLLEVAEQARADWIPVFTGDAPQLSRFAADGHPVERLPSHPGGSEATLAILARARLADLIERHELAVVVLAGPSAEPAPLAALGRAVPRLRVRASGEAGSTEPGELDPLALAPADALARVAAALEDARGAVG